MLENPESEVVESARIRNTTIVASLIMPTPDPKAPRGVSPTGRRKGRDGGAQSLKMDQHGGSSRGNN